MMKIGIGYDIHRLVEGRKMMLGGLAIPFAKGFEGHSDGDVLLHAVCDAILGALGRGDIGRIFPDTDASYKDVPGIEFLEKVYRFMEEDGFRLGNLDCTVIAEEPKIGPYSDGIKRIISNILKADESDVNIKGKTFEKLGVIGKGEAIEAHAVVLLKRKD
ncbi:MAG: 2-C-methyl-D-erythritol 2,4-cyclodiphosphate synthase [Candidatus Omnitrophota bacterium]